MEKSKFVYKNSAKNDFAVNLLIIVIAGLLTFMAAKFFNDKLAIVVYAIAIAVSYCRIAIEAVERILAKKFSADIISTLAILFIFASQKFLVAAIVSLIYALSKSLLDLINAHYSDKIVSNSDLGPIYTAVNGEDEFDVSINDIESGDMVKVSKGEFLAFSYTYTNDKGLTKTYKPGKFSACDSAVVEVKDITNYQIDFETTCDNLEKSKAEKRIDFVVLIYTIAAVFLAIAMCILKITSSNIMNGLYTLGIYLLFACPASINSGNNIAGFFLIKSLKENGIYVNSNKTIEELGAAKGIYYAENVALSGDKIDADVVKAKKAADVVKLDSFIIGKNAEIDEKAVKVGGFKAFKSVGDEEELKSTLSAETAKHSAVYVSDAPVCEIKNVVNIATNGESEDKTTRKNLFELVKGIKLCRFYKWFLYLRTAVGVVVNFLVVGVFASGKFDSILSNKVLETEAVGEDTIGVMNKVLSIFMYDNKLAPWIIAIFHLVLINVLILFVQLFLNNNKKLR